MKRKKSVQSNTETYHFNAFAFGALAPDGRNAAVNGVQEASSSNLDTRTKSSRFSVNVQKSGNFLFYVFCKLS